MTPDEPFLAGQDLPGEQFLTSQVLPDADELFSTRPAASPAEIRSEMRRQMGEDVPRAPRPPTGPDVHQLARDLGLA